MRDNNRLSIVGDRSGGRLERLDIENDGIGQKKQKEEDEEDCPYPAALLLFLMTFIASALEVRRIVFVDV